MSQLWSSLKHLLNNKRSWYIAFVYLPPSIISMRNEFEEHYHTVVPLPVSKFLCSSFSVSPEIWSKILRKKTCLSPYFCLKIPPKKFQILMYIWSLSPAGFLMVVVVVMFWWWFWSWCFGFPFPCVFLGRVVVLVVIIGGILLPQNTPPKDPNFDKYLDSQSHVCFLAGWWCWWW